MTATRYDNTSVALHWLIGIALLAETAFGYLVDDIAPRGTPARGAFINLHKSLGIVLGLLIALRLVWRLLHHAPELPPPTPSWERKAARLGQAAMYACMVALPLSGYVASNFSRYGVRLFGVALPPWGADLPRVYAVFNTVHVVTGYLLCILVAAHVAAALKHALVDRDGVMRSMWPTKSISR